MAKPAQPPIHIHMPYTPNKPRKCVKLHVDCFAFGEALIRSHDIFTFKLPPLTDTAKFPGAMAHLQASKFQYQFLWISRPHFMHAAVLTHFTVLHLLDTSLQCIHAPSMSTVHPLHVLLASLLLTTGSMMKKYRKELPKILMNDSGGNGGNFDDVIHSVT